MCLKCRPSSRSPTFAGTQPGSGASEKSRPPVVITQRGRAATVMLSIEAYEQAERERHLSLILETGEREIGMRKGRDLDAVFADADRLLRDAGM